MTEYEYQPQQPFMQAVSHHSSSIIALTNPSSEIHQFEMKLRCIEQDEDGKYYSYGEPLMNEKGIKTVVSMVQSLANKNSILGNFDKNEVRLLMLNFADVLAESLMHNRFNYEIKQGSDRDQIYHDALNTAYICLKRGFEEGDKKFWKGSVQEVKSVSESVGNQGGMFARMNPFRR